jgi:Flp pilus assembly protein TadG
MIKKEQHQAATATSERRPQSIRGSTGRNGKRRDRGFVLVTMAVTSVVLLGALGMSVDIGRMYIAKNEAQSFADAGALAAALKLDGTSTGVTNAQTAATSLPDKWNFGTTSYSGTTVEVAEALGGPWTNASSPPSPATNYTYVRVTANVAVALYFMPVITTFVGGSTPSSASVGGRAVAVQQLQTTWNEGAFPFSPIAFDGPTGGNNGSNPWGFVAGTQYTIRYESSGKSSCAGDSGDSNHLKNGSARGFWGDNSASVISNQVQGDLQEESLTTGEVLPGVGGAKTTVATDIDDRIAQDGDTTDNTWASYSAPNSGANGRRVVVMPIQSEVNGQVLGFGTFLLTDAGSFNHSGSANWCAIFTGTSNVQDGTGAGASSTPGAYVVRLVQ